MDSFRAFSAAFSVSVAIHAIAGYSFTLPTNVPVIPESATIQIDTISQEQLLALKSAAAVLPSGAIVSKQTPPAHKKIRGIPIPRLQPVPKTQAPSDFQKIVDEKIKKQLQQIKQLEVPPARVSSSMTSAELLNDPQKGGVFLTYFGKVKQKIQTMVYQKAGRNLYGRGTVCVGFVLDSRGQLQRLAVLPKGTQADETMKELALQCIRDSAPFGIFPRDLGPGSVVFNITIFFDGGN